MNKLRALWPIPNPYFVWLLRSSCPVWGTCSSAAETWLTMQMFMILMAMITWHLTTPEQSLVGRLAGGLFVYAMSIPEAYRMAKLR